MKNNSNQLWPPRAHLRRLRASALHYLPNPLPLWLSFGHDPKRSCKITRSEQMNGKEAQYEKRRFNTRGQKWKKRAAGRNSPGAAFQSLDQKRVGFKERKLKTDPSNGIENRNLLQTMSISDRASVAKCQSLRIWAERFSTIENAEGMPRKSYTVSKTKVTSLSCIIC